MQSKPQVIGQALFCTGCPWITAAAWGIAWGIVWGIAWGIAWGTTWATGAFATGKEKIGTFRQKKLLHHLQVNVIAIRWSNLKGRSSEK